MAEVKTKVIDEARVGEVWAAFLAKLALKVDTSALGDYATTEAMATAIATALTGYAKTSEVTTAITTALADYMTESAVNEAIATAIGGIDKLTKKAVDTLPATGEEDIIYLVPNSETTGNNVRDEYMWLNGKYELIGSTKVDLSNYWSKEELVPMTAEELAAILV